MRFVLFVLYSSSAFCRIGANNKGNLKMKKTNLVLASVGLAVLSRGAVRITKSAL